MTSGILRWTSSIQDSMINDPGRQFFEDQVQSQGFLFLEEYMDNIWAAAKQDSFVDLVKTPGRRRVSPQKTRTAVNAHVLPDETDVFQSHFPKSSPPPLASIAEHSDRTIDLSPEVRRSHSAIVEEKEDIEEDIAVSLPPDPLASPAFVDMSVPLREEASGAGIPRNPSLSNFPTLAAPSPLRKSTWNLRESSVEPSQVTTPGTGLTGHHTSWLAKVREAKAMEVTIKRASVAPAGLVAHSGGVKRKSGEIELPSQLPHDDEHEERKVKIPKTSSPDVIETVDFESRPSTTSALQSQAVDVHTVKSADSSAPSLQADSEADLMAPMRKAIESLRARTGKSVAGNLVEASTQERLGVDAEVAKADVHPRPNPLYPASTRDTLATEAIIRVPTPPKSGQQVAEPNIFAASHEAGKRLSLSDLVPKHEQSNATKRTSTNESSISTTPPDSPPAMKKTTFFAPGGPVFNKPPPVFVPPPAAVPKLSPSIGSDVLKGHTSELPGYVLGAPFGLGLHPTKLSRSPPLALLSGQSTQSSSFSDNVFDSQNNVPAWVPDSQDTQVTSQESLPVLERREQPADLDDDDSWRLDDKFAATNQMWTPFAGVTAVEDSMTWSTVPSQSQMGGKSPRQDPTESGIAAATRSQQFQDAVDESDEDMDVDDDIKSDTMDAGKQTVGLLTANHGATKSQLSVASSSSESSQPVGFFGQATKLVTSMLGVSKKTKTEPPKSIQLAAAAAKKQQEEQDRKAARLKDMEARRQAVLQKKVDEEKIKADEEEKKAKDSADRRKKEREENTGKRPLVKADSKHLEDDNKKKKMVVEVPKAKPPSKEKKEAPPTRIRKPSQTTSVRAVTVTKQPSTTTLNQTTGSKAALMEKPAVKATPAPASAKGKGKAPAGSEDAPSKRAMQSQVAMHKRPDAEPPVTSEMIELPEPNSEYSDSEDESRARKFDAPVWTQSPELRAALESQSRVNPDDIFGPVRPLRMEDIFRNRTSRFRARTSSANWSGPDGLKQEEEREYARRMGFR
ncbi:hypothetical protein EDB89DRAFT_1928084 [Lactarius sanguifluus]|nr:hypothetical protein EDB89DRAFT_1928084 [Lactarius sanguifluus]